jgi:hypothetical protein
VARSWAESAAANEAPTHVELVDGPLAVVAADGLGVLGGEVLLWRREGAAGRGGASRDDRKGTGAGRQRAQNGNAAARGRVAAAVGQRGLLGDGAAPIDDTQS